MRKQIFPALAVVLLTLAGCTSSHSERAAKMARNGPKGTFQSDREWYARCTLHNPAWRGPARTEKEWAIRDAAEHEKEFPGHHCTIER